MLWRPERFEELASVAPERHGLRRTLFKCIAPVTRGAIGPERLKWLESLPTQWSLEDISVVHATPTNLWRAPLANACDTELMNAYVTLNTRVVVYGHIHCAYVRRVHSATSANAGPRGLLVALC